MPTLIVTDTAGIERSIHSDDGFSVMEVIRNAGLDDLQALCGGNCSCATCHVIVDRTDFGKLAPATADELDLLQDCREHESTSRLSCQIPFTSFLDGLRVKIANDEG